MANIFKKKLYKKTIYLQNESASTAIEYALIAALLSVSIYIVIFTMGENVAALLQVVKDTLNLLIS